MNVADLAADLLQVWEANAPAGWVLFLEQGRGAYELRARSGLHNVSMEITPAQLRQFGRALILDRLRELAIAARRWERRSEGRN